MLREITLATIETQNGLNDLSKITKEDVEAFKEADITSQEYIGTMEKLRGGLAQVLNVEESSLSSDFIESHIDDIDALIDGDLSKIDELRSAFGSNVIMSLDIDWSKVNEAIDSLPED